MRRQASLASRLAWSIAAVVLGGGFASSASLVPRHPDSRSSSRIEVAGERATVELAMQARSLVEALPALDADGDGELAPRELESARDAAGAYLLDRYRLGSGADPAGELREPLSGRVAALSLDDGADAALGEPTVRATLEFAAERRLDELAIELALFVEQNPWHVDACSVVWNGELQGYRTFEGAETWRFEPDAKRRPKVFADYWSQGLHHIVTGYDHLAFLLALLLAAGSIRAVVGVVTAFTLAHSITLALASLEWIDVDSAWVEMAIALSITYVAVLVLAARAPTSRWIEALLFGLVHGVGFAGLLVDSLIVERLKTPALVGFNLGVETGQVAIVAAVALALRFVPGDRSSSTQGARFLAPRWARVAGASAIAALSLYWFAQRAGWIG